ncbi:MAG TPA: transcription antitermination factor NusB [Tissierellaceae bacterium]
MGRKYARESAMKILFQMDLREEFSKELLDLYMSEYEHDEGESNYLIDAVNKVSDNLDLVDQYITDNIHGWSLSRLAKVDLSILRIAVYELLYRKDIPVEVTINEAIENAKKYSTKDSFKFINGVLGGVVKTIEEGENE